MGGLVRLTEPSDRQNAGRGTPQSTGAMSESHTCISCGKKSPATNTDYTLISAQFGWRLLRARLPDGGIEMEWRCPECWREYKKARDAARAPATGTDTDSSNVFRTPFGSAAGSAPPGSTNRGVASSEIPGSHLDDGARKGEGGRGVALRAPVELEDEPSGSGVARPRRG